MTQSTKIPQMYRIPTEIYAAIRARGWKVSTTINDALKEDITNNKSLAEPNDADRTTETTRLISFKLDEDTYKTLCHKATNKSAAITRALRRYLDQHQ